MEITEVISTIFEKFKKVPIETIKYKKTLEKSVQKMCVGIIIKIGHVPYIKIYSRVIGAIIYNDYVYIKYRT